MHRFIQRLRHLLALNMLLLASLTHAAVVLTVDGVDDPLKSAVSSSVELSQYATRSISDAQARRLYANAPDQVKAALAPYGYYDATTTGDIQQVGKDWHVTLHVSKGEPVKISAVNLTMDKQASAIAPIGRAMRALQKLKDQPLNDGAYDDLRDRVSSAITANGFLDAKLLTHRVEVNRAEHSAVITLKWQVGQRYRYGHVHFDDSQFREDFLDRYVPFKPGDYFSQDQLLQLQQALNGADYFSVVNVLPDVDTAKNGVVDITVQLAPAKRTIYTGGPFIGTDTGVGVRAGIERRWVNNRGHKWKNEVVLAQRLKTVTSLYTVPLPGPNQRSLNYGATYRDSNTDTSQSRTLELVANETEQWHGWTRTLGLHALSGTFTVGKIGDEPDDTPGIEHGRSTEVFAQASLSRKKLDNPNFVHHGWSVSFTASSTAGSLLSDARFTQFIADGKWIDAFGANDRNRLILRGTAGVTSTDNFTALPPQLRFFAGGDQSIRGYAYQEVGPLNSAGRVIGGENLLVASAEVEHYFTRTWGMAAFVDAGNAFTGTNYSPVIGAGLGVRWLSPVGMVRVDVGTPIHNSRESGFELHIVIGPDL